MTLSVLGIRHHGPGSARSVVRALDALGPDIVLVEGPPEGTGIAHFAADPDLVPPVALLLTAADAPERAVFYPFAVHSPELQALRWAAAHGVPARFADLPVANVLAEGAAGVGRRSGVRADPLATAAHAAGYQDPERWWEDLVEQRRDDADVFAALLELMAALRADEGPGDDLRDARREAAMREAVRSTVREGHEQVAFVCGAWHGPAVARTTTATADRGLLRGLPKTKVEATWVPWTAERLTLASGYGAGVASPGWYAHLFAEPDDPVPAWLAKVARVLRAADLDGPPASVIEAVRLAEALAALRGRPLPSLPELDEATRAVLCGGSDVPLALVRRELTVGDAVGSVPDRAPAVPLQRDLDAERRRLRLKVEAATRLLDLDLREPTGLGRSRLLHRLALLDVHWGRLGESEGTGTFRESWALHWRPELSVAVVVAAPYGTTVAAAAAARTAERAAAADALPVLVELATDALRADLPDAIGVVVARLEAVAAVGAEVPVLLAAIPPLALVRRYGSVRRTDAAAVREVLHGMVLRAAVGLSRACVGVDDDVAALLAPRLGEVDDAVRLLDDREEGEAWRAGLRRVADLDGGHGLLGGRATRLLLDAGALDHAAAGDRLARALSGEAGGAAAFAEGLLSGSGTLLVHDPRLRGLVDAWLQSLDEERFTAVLPLLRRTFATFPAGERRRLGDVLERGAAPAAVEELDARRADLVLPVLARILGP